MDSEILDQLTILEKNIDSDATKPKRGRKRKIGPKINKVEGKQRKRQERKTSCMCSIW